MKYYIKFGPFVSVSILSSIDIHRVMIYGWFGFYVQNLNRLHFTNMCFNKEMTGGFTLFSILIGTWIILGKGKIWSNLLSWQRVRVALCFYYFAVMEGLQFVQYFVLDDCDGLVNNLSTQLGWYHICWQPLFSNLAFSALDKKAHDSDQKRTWSFILWFSFISGLLMALRMILPALFPGAVAAVGPDFAGMCNENIEGVCGPSTCVHTGIWHLSWTFKMLKPGYVFPSLSLHFLNMFVAPALMGNLLGSVILFMTGPFIALFFDVGDGERSSIWCFFSIMETIVTAGSQYLVYRRMAKKKRE